MDCSSVSPLILTWDLTWHTCNFLEYSLPSKQAMIPLHKNKCTSMLARFWNVLTSNRSFSLYSLMLNYQEWTQLNSFCINFLQAVYNDLNLIPAFVIEYPIRWQNLMESTSIIIIINFHLIVMNDFLPLVAFRRLRNFCTSAKNK